MIFMGFSHHILGMMMAFFLRLVRVRCTCACVRVLLKFLRSVYITVVKQGSTVCFPFEETLCSLFCWCAIAREHTHPAYPSSRTTTIYTPYYDCCSHQFCSFMLMAQMFNNVLIVYFECVCALENHLELVEYAYEIRWRWGKEQEARSQRNSAVVKWRMWHAMYTRCKKQIDAMKA